MAESKVEVRIRQLESDMVSAGAEAEYMGKLLEEERLATKSMERELADLRQHNALLLLRIDEQQKRLEKWDSRLWGLVAVAIGAILSLSAGLIVALVKR